MARRVRSKSQPTQPQKQGRQPTAKSPSKRKATAKTRTRPATVHSGSGEGSTEIQRGSPMAVRTTGRFIASARSLDKETVKQMLKHLAHAGLRDTCDAASLQQPGARRR